MKQLKSTEVNKALSALRKQITKCGQSQTKSELYANAEQLQHMAFDFKQMTAHGGSWAENHETEK